MTCATPSLDLTQCATEHLDFYSKSVLTTSGGINYYRPSVGGDSTFAAECGESFASFSLAGTNDTTANALFSRHGDTDGRLLYVPSEDHTSIFRVDLDAESKIQAVAVPGVSYLIDVALNDLGVPGAGVGSGSFLGFGYALTFGTAVAERVWRWDRNADETGGTATLWIAPPTGFHTEWEYITQTVDGRIWIGGEISDATSVQCYGTDGTLAFTYSIPVPNSTASMQLTRWGTSVIAFYQDGISNEGVLLRICPDGSVVDFTANVTIAGGPFGAYVAANSYRPKLHSKGDRLVFVDGSYRVFTGFLALPASTIWSITAPGWYPPAPSGQL